MTKRKSFGMAMVSFRTPEQHRAIIQPARANPPKKLKNRKPKRVRVRPGKLGSGTDSISARIIALGYAKYADYLQTDHWRDLKRAWRLSSLYRGWVCHSASCVRGEALSFHHMTYERMGKEELSDLILVCDVCHKRIHQLERKGLSLMEATLIVTKGGKQ